MYRCYFVYEDLDVGGVYLANSGDGDTWTVTRDSVINTAIHRLYVVEYDDRFILFGEDSSHRIIYFASLDGVDWSTAPYMVNRDIPDSIAESPVAWVDNGTLNLIFWESKMSKEFSDESLVWKTPDGSGWATRAPSMRLVLLNGTYHVMNYRKMLINDVTVIEGDIVFLARVIEAGDQEYVWRTASLKPGSGWRTATVQIIEDHGMENLKNIRVWRDSEDQTRFLLVYHNKKDAGDLMFIGAIAEAPR